MATSATSKLLVSDFASSVSKIPSNYVRPISDRPNLLEVETSGDSIPLIDLHELHGPDGQDRHSDRQSSWRCPRIKIKTFLFLKSILKSKTHNEKSEEEEENVEMINIVVPQTIGVDELVRVCNREALNQYDGVEGLATRLKIDLKLGIDLSEDEILKRKEEFGKNAYPCKKEKSFWCFIWEASKFPPYLPTMFAAVIYSLLRIKTKAIHDGLYVEAGIIFLILIDIIMNAITLYMQSHQCEKLCEEKRSVQLEVTRGGRRVLVSRDDIVVGEIVPLKNGVEVPGDGVLFDAHSLKINEQEITGSNEIIPKDIEQDPFVLSRSKVVEGKGTMLVLSVGKNTKWRPTTDIPHETDEEKPLQVYLKRLAIRASWLFVMLASVACAVHLLRYFMGWTKTSNGTPMFIHGKTTADEARKYVFKSLRFLIETVIVAMPVGLYTSVLLILANTGSKMTKDKVLMKKHSCERMGYVTTILCQKTGITENKMLVDDFWAGGINMKDLGDVSQLPTPIKELIIEGIAQNTNCSVVHETGDVYGSQTEQAILSWGNKLGMKFDEARSASTVHHIIPFNQKKKYGGVALQVGTQGHVHWKGSAKIILSSCQWYLDGANNRRPIIDEERRKIEDIIEGMCNTGMRCAALAYQSYELESLPTVEEPHNLVLLAIIGIKDPCRPGTKDAISASKSLGVKFRLVTDDNKLTATAIAKECGILGDNAADDNVMTGAQFRQLSDEERKCKAEGILVFAESNASDILLFAKSLKKIGHVVAATGTGNHDSAILLREVDVSIAMGTGSTVAEKEISDIIIFDGGVATIVKVIQCSRSQYTSIQRYVLFGLTVSGSALAICLVEFVFYDAFPFNSVQHLLLNLIIGIVGALTAYSPTTHHLMGEKPVGISDPVITKTMWLRSVTQVIYLLLSLAVIKSDSILKLKHGDTDVAEKVINTLIFSSSVSCLIFFGEFEIRDKTVKKILKDNMFLIAMSLPIIIQIIVIGFLGIFISSVRLDLKQWVISMSFGLISQTASRFPLQPYIYLRPTSPSESREE